MIAEEIVIKNMNSLWGSFHLVKVIVEVTFEVH